MNKKIANRIKILVVVGILAVLSVGGIRAYMTDHETAANEFTIGKVDFNLYETSWDGELPDGTYIATAANALGKNQAKNLYSGQVIPKDPAIKNNSKNDAYVRMGVRIPVAEVVAADRYGNILNNGEPIETELFSYVENTGTGMRQVPGSPRVEYATPSTPGIATPSTAQRVYHVYEYEYTGGGSTEIPLPAGQDILPLFNEVIFANIVDGEVEAETEFIHVSFKAIQSGGFDSPEEAWDAYARQNPKRE